MILEGTIEYYLAGTIMMFMIGIAAGNYITSAIYRLPRGLVIANDPPYCECDKRMYLSKRDLFPFFSWFANKGQCRFCDIKIPVVYTIVEFMCGFLFVYNWIEYGISEHFVIILCLTTFIIGTAAIHYNDGKLMTSMVCITAGFGAILRTLLDGTIYQFVQSGYLALMFGIVVWLLTNVLFRQRNPFPHYAIMFGVGGLCVGRELLLEFIIVSVVLSVLFRLAGCISKKFVRSYLVLGITCAVLIGLTKQAVYLPGL